MTKAKAVRCAIYTRKSSEEGLDQAFNSLDAQREACEAYVLSQAGEGWHALAARYDDGGFSGGSMERPALKRLLADVAAGWIDTIVVYKIDRLTRSLNDFARIVEVLDRTGASFVSVTQAFNTTTSMGRLTLNVLLSFAQFEREVTGERTRDKIAASKAKGMWMGGNLPLGYDAPSDHATRRLMVNGSEAETVRLIFRRYLELGSVDRLERWLHENDIRSKAWISTRGRHRGGLRFSRGALFHLLKNRVYLGEILHKGAAYPNAHPPIVELELFDAVQAKLADGARWMRVRRTGGDKAALTGLIFDAQGRPMSPSFSYGRSQRRYLYYVSAPLLKGGAVCEDDTLRRVPGQIVDDLVLETASRLAGRCIMTGELRQVLRRIEIHPDHVHLMMVRLTARGLDQVEQRLRAGEHAIADPADEALIAVTLPVRVKLRGGRSWLMNPDGRASGRKGHVDPVLVGGLARAHAAISEAGLRAHRATGRLTSKAPASAYQRGIAALAFLAPDIQAAIIAGRQPAGLKLEHLLRDRPPLAWADQRLEYGL